MMRLVTLVSILVLVAGLSNATESNVFISVDQDSSSYDVSNVNDEHRSLVTSCPVASQDIAYVPPTISCSSNYNCVPNWAPFKITGCGCGCHRVVSSTSTCPVLASQDIIYRSKSTATCSTLNFKCIPFWARFDITGCGCGCRKVVGIPTTPTAPITPTKPIATPAKPITPTKPIAKPTKPVTPTKPITPAKPTARPPVASPTVLRNTSIVCPSGSDFVYRSHAEPCRKTFRCLRGREFFNAPGCGCGCKAISPTTSPVKKPTSKPT